MNTANAVLLALGILVVNPAAAEPLAARRPVHPYPPAQPFFNFNALAPETIVSPPSPFAGASSAPRPYQPHETDGLGRNPDDCVKYGCVDNGGG